MKQLTRLGVLCVAVAVLLIAGAAPTYAQLSVSKSSISFGSVIGFTPKTDSFYVKNSTQLGYALTGITNTSPRFTVSGDPGAIVADSVKIRVTFTPDSVGTVTDTVYVTHTAPGSLLKVALSGNGISGIVLQSPRTGGAVTALSLVDTFATHIRYDSVTIRNTTSSSLTISSMTVRNLEFTILKSTPFTIPSLDSQRVRISYQGTSVGRDRDTLIILNNSPTKGASPIKLVLNARAISHLVFAQGTDAVGRVRAYDNFDTLRVTAASAGTAGGRLDPKVPIDSARAALASVWNSVDTVWVRVDSITFTGPHFRNITPTPYTHRVGGAYDRNINFIYQPKNLSPVHRDTLVLYTNDNIPTGNRITLLVEGASRRAIYVRNTANGTSLSFGTVGLGVSLDSAMRIHNFQDIALRVDSIRLARNNPKYQITSQTTGFTVNHGDTAKVYIRFTAIDTVSTNASGNMLDTVLVYTDFSATPLRLPLTAKVTSTIVYFPAATSIGFGTLTVNLFKDSTIKVYNRTKTAYRIDSVSVKFGKDFYILSNVLTTQLPAGDSTAIQIRYKPVTVGLTRDTVFIWHNFAPLLTNPTKIVISGTGSTQALIDPANYVTVDNVSGLEGYAISSPDSSYVETTINGFYNNISATSFGGNHRRSPNLSGAVNGSSARWTFRIDSTAPYLIYHYVVSSQNSGSMNYVHLRKFGVGGIVDSMRYNLRDNFTPLFGGSWYPLMMHRIDGVGPGAASITIGGDILTSTFLRCDAVRFLRSTQKADIEFGRRTIDFSPIRVPEDFGQISIGDEYVRQYRLYNLGRDTLVISDIKIVQTLTPVPWFLAKNYTKGTALKIPPMTVGADGKETGGYFDLQLAFTPYQEGVARDSMVIFCNDSNEPQAYNILNGEGLNYNFIMNASLSNTEPHFRAPAPPDVPKLPLYRETANGTWANSTSAGAIFPITGNNYSRVNVGGATSLPHQAYYEFQLPEIALGKIPTDGRYILDFGGPVGSSNAYTNTLVKVTHTFGVPVDTVNFNSTTVGLAYPFWVQIGGTAKTFFLAPGGPITIEYARTAQTDAAGGAGFLRTDLLRMRKVPTGALIGVNVAQGSIVSFGDVSFRKPGGLDGKANRKEILLGSRGESQIVVKSMKFRDGRYFSLSGAPSTPLYMRALVGEQKLTMLFTPDRIATDFRDTLEVLSNSVRDSVLLVPVIGNGIGGIYMVDDDGAVEEVSSTPAFGGLYIGGWDKTKMNNWQVETSNVPDSIGRGKTRHLLPIYLNGNARFEWLPLIADGASGDSVLVNVAVTVPRGYTKASPAARYRVYSTGGNITKDTTVNQNNPPLSGGSSLVEINLGNHFFLRGGRDVAGGQAYFGHVRLDNDTARVSQFYGSLTNFARRDTFALLADAIILRELDRLQPSITSVKENVPVEFALSQNYPNPFNPTTTIEFSLARRVPVELKIYDLLGREVAVLLQNNDMNPGRYIMRWDGRNTFGQSVATGVYFYRLVAGDFVQSKKMVLVK